MREERINEGKREGKEESGDSEEREKGLEKDGKDR